ncbi:hypothetical protein [Paenarthrobacter sp. CAP02]|uniref:hypothetical protein n=1 Tax=Paenarthrobacter sp. CAP02 TaxID=3158144 RepID=UPI0032DB5355
MEPVSELTPIETPDVSGAYPRLSQAQIELLGRTGTRRATSVGEVLIHEGNIEADFFVVLQGTVLVVEGLHAAEGRELAEGRGTRILEVHGPGRFLGEL